MSMKKPKKEATHKMSACFVAYAEGQAYGWWLSNVTVTVHLLCRDIISPVVAARERVGVNQRLLDI